MTIKVYAAVKAFGKNKGFSTNAASSAFKTRKIFSRKFKGLLIFHRLIIS